MVGDAEGEGDDGDGDDEFVGWWWLRRKCEAIIVSKHVYVKLS